jgi:hypothetical protein
VARFFELRDEFYQRKLHLVAKLIGYKETYQLTCIVDDQKTTGERQFPDSISLVTYTSDPSFFVDADNGEDFLGCGLYRPASAGTCLRSLIQTGPGRR